MRRIPCRYAGWLVLFLVVAGLRAAGGDIRLVDAVRTRDRDAVLSLLKQHADVNLPQADGATALHWAAHWDDVDTAELLIRAGANVNAKDDLGVTPLVLASSNGNAAMIERLLRAGADPNAVVWQGESPLMMASRTGNVEAVRALLAYKADVNARETWNGQTALMWAVAAAHAPAAQMLIDHGADIHATSNSGLMPLMFAARIGDIDSARMLLAAGAEVDQARPDNATPLLIAVVNGHEDMIDLLLDKGANPNVEGGSTELTRAGARAKPTKLTFRRLKQDFISQRGVTRGNMFGTPLHAAVHMANLEVGNVHFTIKFDKVRVIKALLAHGANVNARITTEEPRWNGERYRTDLTGATPFVFAAKAADIELMRLLLANGADPNLRTKYGTTPLMVAAGISYAPGQDVAPESKYLEAVKLLVNELGADVNAVNDRKETAMHGAAYSGANSIVKFLVEKGARIDVKEIDGRTPLTVAEGVGYGGGFFPQPQTADLIRKLGRNLRA